MVETRRVDLLPLITHQFALADIESALDLFSHQREGVLKVALHPAGVPAAARTLVSATVDREC
jgi:hypothetical protein